MSEPSEDRAVDRMAEITWDQLLSGRPLSDDGKAALLARIIELEEVTPLTGYPSPEEWRDRYAALPDTVRQAVYDHAHVPCPECAARSVPVSWAVVAAETTQAALISRLRSALNVIDADDGQRTDLDTAIERRGFS